MKINPKPGPRGIAVELAPRIGWIVEEGTVRVFEAEKGELLKLGYPEAAVWDLISRYSLEADIVPKLAVIGGLNRAATRALLHSCLRGWLRSGILVQAGSRG